MKILLINSVCNQGSTGKIVFDLYEYYGKHGHDVAICYGRGPVRKEHNIYKFSSTWEMYVHAGLTRLTGMTGCFSPLATSNLIKFIDEFKPDVIHIHELHAYFVSIEPLVRHIQKKNIKTVWTFHCEFMYTGKCGYAYECTKWKKQCGGCPYLQDYPKSWFLDWTFKMQESKKKYMSDFKELTITTPSTWLYQRVKESFLKDFPLKVIANGINCDIFKPHDYDALKKKHFFSENQKIILAIAPDLMSKRKGGGVVLNLANRMKDKPYKFIMIGIDNLNISFPANVIPLGRTADQKELAAYYSMADITLILSEIENFPTVALESLCCGTPVVGFDSGGTKETAPASYGYFVSFGDVESLEYTINAIFDNSLYLENSIGCAAFGKQKYNKNLMAETYLKLYTEQKLSSSASISCTNII